MFFGGYVCHLVFLYDLSQELSNLCHSVQHPWQLTSRDFWSSRNDRKALPKQKCVLRIYFGVSQKWWMLELSNLCHCVQYPWKLTSRNFWSSGNAANTPLTPPTPPDAPQHPTPPDALWYPQMSTPHGYPGGSDQPDQNQASDPNELCSSL